MKWEVRTMRSGTSFFNVTVWKKTVLRFWPIWAVGLVFWVLALPAQGMMALQRQLENGGDWLLSFSASVDGLGGDTALSFAVVFGLLAAMAVCSHLYSSRSANFMGALPVRREGLFVSHYAAGLSMLLLPNIVVFLLTLLGAVMWPPLMFWLTALSGMEFFFYSFAVCIGMFTGHLLALPIFYAVFNALAAALRWLLDYALLSFYYGAGQTQHIRFLFKKAISASIIISLLTAVGVSLLRAQITTLFGLTGSLAQQAQPALIITACSFLMVGITRCISAYFYAVEKTNVSTLLVYIEPCLFFPIALWTLPLFWGLNGVWAAYPAAQLALAVLCIALYIRVEHRSHTAQLKTC